MVKDDLIYDWRNTEIHIGHRLLAIFVVAAVFVGAVSLVNVKVGDRTGGVLKSASVLRFPDDELGRFWELKAEEDGPFPGRLELPQPDRDLLSELGSSDAWNRYEITAKPLVSSDEVPRMEIASKGTRYFPKRKTEKELSTEGSSTPFREVGEAKAVVLIPFEKEALKAIPDDLPDFSIVLGVDANPALWRFLLKLGADGSVDQCVSLVGETDETLDEVLNWMRTVRFNEGEEGRWLGLQMEIISKETQ